MLGEMFFIGRKRKRKPQMNPGGRSSGCPKTGEQRERINGGFQCPILVMFGSKSDFHLAFTPVIQDPHAVNSTGAVSIQCRGSIMP